MRKRFTADIELSESDMKAFLEIVAANALSFEMHDVDEPKHKPGTMGELRERLARATPPKANGHIGKRFKVDFPASLMVHITPKDDTTLARQQREMLADLREKYGVLPFRKGEASHWLEGKFGHAAGSALSIMCRRGYLAAS